MLAEQTAVTMEKPNIIPLFRWEDQAGAVFGLPQAAKRESSLALNPLFPFTVSKAITDLELLIPPEFIDTCIGGVYLDGKKLQPAGTTEIFDDPYLVYPFDVAEGKHTVELKLIAEVASQERLYLRGNFGAQIAVDPDRLRYFNPRLSEKTEVTLTQVPKQLRTDCSWTEQGYPFYSGCVRYEFELDIPEDFTHSDLVLPSVGDGVKVYLDGELLDTGIFAPYRFPLHTTVGKHRLELEVCNTFGNMFSGFCQRSGLLETPYLKR